MSLEADEKPESDRPVSSGRKLIGSVGPVMGIVAIGFMQTLGLVADRVRPRPRPCEDCDMV